MSEMTPLPPRMGLVAPRAMKVRPRTEEVIPRNDPGRESSRGLVNEMWFEYRNCRII